MQAKKTSEWPKDELEYLSKCPSCDSDKRKLIHNDLEDVFFKCAPGKWQLYQCESCKAAYLDPRPNETSISKAYDVYYTHNDVDKTSIVDRLFNSELLAKAYNGRLNAKYGLKRQPSSIIMGNIFRLIPFVGHFFDPFGRSVPRLPFENARLLDFGCGDGRFMQLAEEAGWNCSGIDFDPCAIKVAESAGLNVRLGGYDLLEEERGYDCITLSHVIEHVHDPRRIIEACFNALNPGGTLWMETPNILAYGYLRYGKNWRGLDCPRHLVIFSPDALESAMRDAGFFKIKRTPRLFVSLTTYWASENVSDSNNLREKHLSDVLKPLPIIDGLRTIFSRDRYEFIQMSGVREK